MDQSSGALFQLPKPVQQVVITVRLDDGTIVERYPSELVALPASLTLPLADLAPL